MNTWMITITYLSLTGGQPLVNEWAKTYDSAPSCHLAAEMMALDPAYNKKDGRVEIQCHKIASDRLGAHVIADAE